MMLSLLLPTLLAGAVHAQSSSCQAAPVSATVPAPVAATGYSVRLVANGLTKPRGIIFDAENHLLVVESGVGVTGFSLDDQGGDCVSVASKKTVIDDTTLNHGIAFNKDHSTLFVSSADTAYSYAYNAQDNSVAAGQPGRELVTAMAGADHTTRTLLFSNFTGDTETLVITRGSTANIDPETLDISSGHSQIKSFDVGSANNNTFTGAGTLLGWGLRNDVGIAEHPVTGGLWSVENSVDQMNRSNVDIHTNNPAEELNFLGYLSPDSVPSEAYMASAEGGANANQGKNFGYPRCFTAWAPEEVPDYPGLKVGQQFAIGGQDYDTNDTWCSEQVAPRLSFAAHMAPLDIKFNADGSEAWVAFHGSWNREEPIGYKVSSIAFSPTAGEPIAAADVNNGYVDIITNPDDSQCPDNCFRPVGLAFDRNGRLFFSSDSTGEIYVVDRTEATPTTPAPGQTSGATAPPGETGTSAAVVRAIVPGGLTVGAIAAAGLLF